MATLKIYSTIDDYCLLKVRIALSLACCDASVETGVTSEYLRSIDASAKTIALEAPGGNIAQHVPILCYIAHTDSKSQLLGSSEIDMAQVDQWLEFSWSELGMLKVFVKYTPSLLITFMLKFMKYFLCILLWSLV